METPGGSLAARTVILATNAYSGPIWPELRRSVVPVPSFQIASDPLPQSLRRAILPGGQSVSDTRRLLRYFRQDPEGRLVMGARGSFGQVPPEQAMQLHLKAVREIFPEAAGLGFPYRWGGHVAMTSDHMPHLHELAPGLLAGCCDGDDDRAHARGLGGRHAWAGFAVSDNCPQGDKPA